MVDETRLNGGGIANGVDRTVRGADDAEVVVNLDRLVVELIRELLDEGSDKAAKKRVRRSAVVRRVCLPSVLTGS